MPLALMFDVRWDCVVLGWFGISCWLLCYLRPPLILYLFFVVLSNNTEEKTPGDGFPQDVEGFARSYVLQAGVCAREEERLLGLKVGPRRPRGSCP